MKAPIVTTYTQGVYTHTFSPDTQWARIYVTGGGSRGSGNGGGSGSHTAISCRDIEVESASIAVGAHTSGSSYDDGINLISVNGGTVVGADLNIGSGRTGYSNSSANADARGGGSFWGASGRAGNTAVVWGAGGSVYRASSHGTGAGGVVIIEEHRYPKRSRAPKITSHTASATHVFDPEAKWAMIWVTGGGQTSVGNGGGNSSRVAMKAVALEDIESAALVVAGTAGTSSYDDGIDLVTAGPDSSSGADVEMPSTTGGYSSSSANADARGAASFWGSGARLGEASSIWGAGGSVFSSTSHGQGAPGMILIEEYY